MNNFVKDLNGGNILPLKGEREQNIYLSDCQYSSEKSRVFDIEVSYFVRLFL